MIEINDSGGPQTFIVGAGNVGLAAAAHLIRDGRMACNDVHVLEGPHHGSGSLDARGTPDHGYIMRGRCMFDEEASGEEILIELFAHLHFDDQAPELMRTANCIPCMMPLSTSQFMVRSPGDRPAIVPQGAANFAFLVQYCEIADDVVFAVEYSVRSAQAAVGRLLRLDCEVSPIYKGHHDPGVLPRSVEALLR